jgi:hypothetical protein
MQELFYVCAYFIPDIIPTALQVSATISLRILTCRLQVWIVQSGRARDESDTSFINHLYQEVCLH